MSTWGGAFAERVRTLWVRFRRWQSSSAIPESQADSSPVDRVTSESSGLTTNTTATNRPISVTGTSQSVPAELCASSADTAIHSSIEDIPYSSSALPASKYPLPERNPVATSSTNTDESFTTRTSADGKISTIAATDAFISATEPGSDTDAQTASDFTGTRTDNYANERQTCTDDRDNPGNAETSKVSLGNDITKEPTTYSTAEIAEQVDFTGGYADEGVETASTGKQKYNLPGTDICTAEERTDTFAETVIRTEEIDEKKTETGDEEEEPVDIITVYPETPAESDKDIQRGTEYDISVHEEKAAMTTETENPEEVDVSACTDNDTMAAREKDSDLHDSAEEPESGSRITIPSSSSGFSSSNAESFSFENSANSTTLTNFTAADDTGQAASSSGDATELSSSSLDLADADVDVEGVMNAALEAAGEQLSDDVSAPDTGTHTDTGGTSSKAEPASPTPALSMVMNNMDNAQNNLQVGHLDNLTQNKLTLATGGTGGSGAGGTDGDKTGGGGSEKTGGDDSDKTDGDDSDKTGGGCSGKTGGDDSDKTGGDDSDKTGGGGSDKTGGGDSGKTSGGDSGRTGGDDIDKTGGSGSDMTGGDDSDKTGGGDIDKTGGGGSGKTGGGGSDKTGGGDSDKTGGGGSDKTGGGGSGGSFTGQRYADKAFLAELKRSLKKHVTAEDLEALCDLYSEYAEADIQAKDVASLFAILEERGDMKTDDVIYLQTLLWSAGQRELFTLVAETVNAWERDYEETVSHLSTAVLDQGEDQLKFLIHKRREDVSDEELQAWKTGVAKLMRIPAKHFTIQGVEPDFRGETLVTTRTPAVVCEALYKAMDREDTQEKLEELDVGKVAFEGIQVCQQEKVKVVIITQPENQKMWVTAPQCQEDLSEKLRLSLVLGDILTADADVIVTGEDPPLNGYGGVSETLLKAGGEAFQKEREEVLRTHGGQLTKGSVYITKGVRNFSLVVHAILERRSQTSESEWTASMAGLYTAAVEKSMQRGYSRIAIPILGTGAAKAPPDKAMRAAMQGLNRINIPDRRKVQVLLYTKGKEILKVAEAELKKARN